jgi:hypothetical protein
MNRVSAILALPLFLGACSQLDLSVPVRAPWSSEIDSNVVYALGSREAFASPLKRQLKPACPVLRFRSMKFAITDEHEAVLSGVAEAWAQDGGRFLVVGYAPPELPEGYARSLSERRAQAVRQRLIELGVETADLQTAGFGNDFGPSGPNQDVVIIFSEDDRQAENPENDEEASSQDADLITVSR